MSTLRVREHPIDDLGSLYDRLPPGTAPGPFSTPSWLAPWLTTQPRNTGPLLLVAEGGNGPVGVAPLRLDGDTARFFGSPDVCDYQDFATATGAETDVSVEVASHLVQKGVRTLDLGSLLPDAAALAGFRRWGRKGGPPAVVIQDGRTAEVDLPTRWDDYLARLSRKNRHEFRRKERRLIREGKVTYRVETRADGDLLARFFDLFVRSRTDKAGFLTRNREAWFRAMAASLAQAETLRMGTLEVNGQTAAITFGFIHSGTAYLYNSGFDPALGALSVGIVSKGWAVRAAMEEGCRRYSFLKGDEPYKRRLGGKTVPLVRMRVDLT